jgi:hypothetical protein
VGFRPSFISLRRLLLGAALVLVGFFLSSLTTASADDLGLTATADKLVTTATDIPAAVDSATTAAAVVVDPVKTVVAAVKPTETVTATFVQPVEQVLTATTSTVTKATTVLTTTTSDISRDVVESVLTATDDAVAPVVSVVVVPVAGTPSSVGGPEVTEPAQELVSAAAPADTGQEKDLVESVVERARAQRALRAEQALAPTQVDRPLAVSIWTSAPEVASASAGDPAASHAPVDQPSVPGPRNSPAPALPAGGAASGSSAHGSSAPFGGELAVTPASVSMPVTSSAALRSSTLRPNPGPVEDPGSRPD